MRLRWLKPYLPRGLFARATLTLLLPVVALLVVVTIVFVQRHFQGVTEQMTQTMIREIELVRQAPDPAVTDTLEIDLRRIPEEAVPAQDRRRWYDFSGIVVIRELRAAFPDLDRVLLPDDDHVRLVFGDADGALEVAFDRRHVSARRPYLLFVNLLGAAALMTVISYLYLRNQLRPITRLAKAAEAFGRGRSVPYKPAGAVEVKAAGRAFLDMRGRIERQIEQRTLMLSGVSHDMRTPLTRLRLGLAMIDEDEAAPLLRDVDDMQRLLDGFLDFARDAQEGEPVPVAVMEFAAQVVEDMRRAGGEVRLVAGEDTDDAEVMLRVESMRRALQNLIGNALRYGTRAEVSVALTERALRIRVEDDGPGIPPDRFEEALRPFTRLDPARNQDRGSGIGLGLSIVMDVARAHGGTLRPGQSARLGGLMVDLVIPR
jgi:two-component system osmolarity sensor histidine kinase EnvZ